MTLKICENIAKYRKERNITQTELAEYLGVSPQAVSKWEQKLSVPDIYLLPKLAFFFQVSIDALFGNSELDVVSLLVSKYESTYVEKDYKEAKMSLETILEEEPENTKAMELLCKLEYYRAMEYLEKSRSICERLQSLSAGVDEALNHRTNVQMLRFKQMLGEPEGLSEYEGKFRQSNSGKDFNYWIIALCIKQKYEEVLMLGDKYVDTFSVKEQKEIYPNLMEAAYRINDVSYVEKCFRYITEKAEDEGQIFNAWWLLFKTYEKNGNSEAERCKEELLGRLPKQGYNAYVLEKIKAQLQGETKNKSNVL